MIMIRIFMVFLLLICTPVMADQMFVLSNQANLMSTPSMEGETIGVLKHGTEVNIIETKNIWVKIKYKRKSGWICKFSLSKNNPLHQSVIAKVDTINLKKQARKRASSYSTAATTRGLSEKDDTTVTTTDYKSLKDMESFRPTVTEIQDFIQKGALDQ
tara:strand:- start:3 stop:476 length:474 start_codon:yes stop_codon:yes gene_type:complete